jgi:hypothetical protein
MSPADPMLAPLSLSNVLTVVVALVCFWTMSPQARGGVVRLWRLAIPAAFAAVVALMLLAGVFQATLLHDAEWLAALLLGGLIGRSRGWTLPVEIDQARGLVRLPRAMDGLLMAGGTVALASIDFISAAVDDNVIPPEHVAAAAALCAGFLGCRALAIIARSNRAPHVGLHTRPEV